MFMTAVPMGQLLKASTQLPRSPIGVFSSPQSYCNGHIQGDHLEERHRASIWLPRFWSHQQKSLRKIFLAGWLHTEIVADIGVVYTFSSPLHRRCIDWMINGSPKEFKITDPNVTEFALAVMENFSHQSLSYQRILGPNEQSTAEAQFQDEFYRASFKHTNGCAVSFPECGMRKGRIVFFIE